MNTIETTEANKKPTNIIKFVRHFPDSKNLVETFLPMLFGAINLYALIADSLRRYIVSRTASFTSVLNARSNLPSASGLSLRTAPCRFKSGLWEFTCSLHTGTAFLLRKAARDLEITQKECLVHAS